MNTNTKIEIAFEALHKALGQLYSASVVADEHELAAQVAKLMVAVGEVQDEYCPEEDLEQEANRDFYSDLGVK